MAYKKYKHYGGSDNNVVVRGLGQIVGLILGLYVFDTIIDAVIPYQWTCATAGHTLNLSTVGSATVYCGNTTNLTGTAVAGWFGTAAGFVGSMLPIVGILGVFYILWRILKKTGLF